MVGVVCPSTAGSDVSGYAATDDTVNAGSADVYVKGAGGNYYSKTAANKGMSVPMVGAAVYVGTAVVNVNVVGV